MNRSSTYRRLNPSCGCAACTRCAGTAFRPALQEEKEAQFSAPLLLAGALTNLGECIQKAFSTPAGPSDAVYIHLIEVRSPDGGRKCRSETLLVTERNRIRSGSGDTHGRDHSLFQHHDDVLKRQVRSVPSARSVVTISILLLTTSRRALLWVCLHMATLMIGAAMRSVIARTLSSSVDKYVAGT